MNFKITNEPPSTRTAVATKDKHASGRTKMIQLQLATMENQMLTEASKTAFSRLPYGGVYK